MPFVLNPDWQVRDSRNAVNYIMTLDATDQDNVFNLGICMGAGWAAFETAFDTRIKALSEPLHTIRSIHLPFCSVHHFCH
jgi:cephalosporin-C deacetylase-like acetyl esterase